MQTSQGARTSEIDPEDDNEREIYATHQINASGIATPDTMGSGQETSHPHFRPEISGVGYDSYSGMRESTYARYGGQLPPTPEDHQHYAISSPGSYPPQSAPVGVHYNQPVAAYHTQEARRPIWQPTEYNPGQQLPPMNHAWSQQMVSPMNQYGGGWGASTHQQQNHSMALPPMQPPMHEQHEQAYEQNAFMKAESLNGQQS